jgi:2-dehydro-3-deoxyphosphooctonate aldolase (KDO 8-P synthase)
MLKRVCETMKKLSEELGILYIFKSSFDKANRSSHDSKRGPGMEEGLRDLESIRKEFGVPVLTDIHEREQVKAVSQVVDVLQIPAFLSRQTDLLQACAESGKWVNVKKGQFMAPQDAAKIADKIKACGSDKYLVTERGVSFGYNNLVFDPRSPEIIHEMDIPFVFDGTHSTQLPGAGKESGGDRRFAPVLMRAAVASDSTLSVGAIKTLNLLCRSMPGIADLQAGMAAASVRAPGVNLLVRAPIPCDVSAGIDLDRAPTGAAPDVAAVVAAVCARANATRFPGVLRAADLAAAAQNASPAGTSVARVELLGRLLRTDATREMLVGRPDLRIPDEFAWNVGPRTVAFFLDPADVAVSVLGGPAED